MRKFICAGMLMALAGFAVGDITSHYGPEIAAQLNTVAQLATGVITSDEIAANAIAAGDISTGGVTTVEILDATILDADVSASADIALTKLASAGLGTPVATKANATEAQSDVVITTVNLTNVVLIATDGSAEGESQKVLDADDGAFTILLCVANCQSVTSAGATNTFVLSFGTAAAGDDATLTGTEVDIIPSTEIDTTGGTVLTNAFDAVLGAPATFDGTGTAKDVFLNFGIADADMDANVTNTITGTLTLITTKCIDN